MRGLAGSCDGCGEEGEEARGVVRDCSRVGAQVAWEAVERIGCRVASGDAGKTSGESTG